MKRLIDANALKAEFTGNFHEMWHYTGIRAMIDVAPTVDAVEVVRCKDCKMEYGCRVAQWLGENGFCSYGEKQEEHKL